MHTLFRVLLRSAPRSLLLLFLIVTFAATGVLVIRQLVENVQRSISVEMRPYLGGDIRISANATFTGSIRESIQEILPQKEGYDFAEKVEFYTTAFDTSGKSELIRVIAVNSGYPLYSVYRTSQIGDASETSGTHSSSTRASGKISATKNVIDRFGKTLKLDSKTLVFTHRIDETSEVGVSFGDEGYVVILPMEELEGTKLLSLGARLQKSLLIKTPSDAETTRLFALLKEQSAQKFNKKLDVDSYLSQAEKSNQTIEEFGRYTLLILCVCLGFAAVSLYTGVARYFEAVQPALSITRLLGMSSWQQVGVFLMGGALLWALSSLVAFGIGQSIIFFVRRFPEAASFQMLPDPIMFSFSVTAGGIFIVLAPQVYRCLRSGSPHKNPEKDTGGQSIWKRVFPWKISYPLFLKERLFWLRSNHFWAFDGIRTLSRPGIPTGSILFSLVIALSLSCVFLVVTNTFRHTLTDIQSGGTNLYATNILESDVSAIRDAYGSDSLYSIIRGKIVSVRGIAPEGREFTREFSITTNSLNDVGMVRGSGNPSAKEVTVDEEFADRLGVDVGDAIEFSVSGRKFSLQVSGIRARKSSGFAPFFYFQVSPDAFSGAPKTYFLARNSPDIEADIAKITQLSGPHVACINVERIALQVKKITDTILSVLSLFLGFLVLFAIGAVASLFTRIIPLFSQQYRLYGLLGMSDKERKYSFQVTTGSIVLVGVLLSLTFGTLLSFGTIAAMPLLTFHLPSLLMGIVYTLLGGILTYGLLVWLLQGIKER